ncbi:SRPBCC family protein [Phenylobacterium sp.]|jgi:uncharacterized protein YndB with AHSA1/START domain|uniref:SRPBCC family protein n=1 Tax=Phenylobacterium sp. TaxID=1871053 RepID=UPI002F945B66
MKLAISAAAAALAIAGAANAAVTDRSPAGFQVTLTTQVAAPPAKVWDAVMRPYRWWSSGHTWSGDAKNLSMDGDGCFCEKLKRGAVRHMTIVYAEEDTQLRLFGALGPLQFTGASGHMAFVLKPEGQGTTLTLTYNVGGYAKGGLAETFAAPVDQVLGEQLARLKKSVETGKPD